MVKQGTSSNEYIVAYSFIKVHVLRDKKSRFPQKNGKETALALTNVKSTMYNNMDGVVKNKQRG